MENVCLLNKLPAFALCDLILNQFVELTDIARLKVAISNHHLIESLNVNNSIQYCFVYKNLFIFRVYKR